MKLQTVYLENHQKDIEVDDHMLIYKPKDLDRYLKCVLDKKEKQVVLSLDELEEILYDYACDSISTEKTKEYLKILFKHERMV